MFVCGWWWLAAVAGLAESLMGQGSGCWWRDGGRSVRFDAPYDNLAWCGAGKGDRGVMYGRTGRVGGRLGKDDICAVKEWQTGQLVVDG